MSEFIITEHVSLDEKTVKAIKEIRQHSPLESFGQVSKLVNKKGARCKGCILVFYCNGRVVLLREHNIPVRRSKRLRDEVLKKEPYVFGSWRGASVPGMSKQRCNKIRSNRNYFFKVGPF